MKLIDRALFKFLKIERSYAQSGEDKILRHLFNSRNKDTITYLDVGTNHPVMSNNTYLFYRTGSSGVCIEPNPLFASMIRKQRPRDICLNVGLGEEEASETDFFVMSAHTLSTFAKHEAEDLARNGKYEIEKVIKIGLVNINSVIGKYFSQSPDLVSLDVEGWNEEVVRSFDFTMSRPFCFCVETLTFADDGTGKKIEEIFEIFGDNGYEVYADTHINTIFIDKSTK